MVLFARATVVQKLSLTGRADVLALIQLNPQIYCQNSESVVLNNPALGPVVQRDFVTILALNQLDLTEGFNAKIN
jgi:hypothetical protein